MHFAYRVKLITVVFALGKLNKLNLRYIKPVNFKFNETYLFDIHAYIFLDKNHCNSIPL